MDIFEPHFTRKRRLLGALTVFSCVLFSACVQKTEYDALQRKLDSTAQELAEAKDSLKKSQDQLADLQAHRYQTFTTGGRTWRLDSAKGTSCVLLASEQDWRNAKTKEQSCACEDLFRDTEFPTSPDSTLLRQLVEKRAKRLGCE